MSREFSLLASARLDILQLRLNWNSARFGSNVLRFSFCGFGSGSKVYQHVRDLLLFFPRRNHLQVELRKVQRYRTWSKWNKLSRMCTQYVSADITVVFMMFNQRILLKMNLYQLEVHNQYMWRQRGMLMSTHCNQWLFSAPLTVFSNKNSAIAEMAVRCCTIWVFAVKWSTSP